MNKNKIEKISAKVDALITEDSLTSEEYLVFVANLLIAFGSGGVKQDAETADLNVFDADELERASYARPDDPYVASLLQGHILIKWSTNL